MKNILIPFFRTVLFGVFGIIFYVACLVSCFNRLPIFPEPDDPPFPDNLPATGLPPEKNTFIHAEGRYLADGDGNRVFLKGIAFSNHVYSWEQSGNNWNPSPDHPSGTDYENIRDLGFNSVRFYLNYRFFENDKSPYVYKESGFDWLMQNLAWARETGIYLILNMHYPCGGYQSLGGGSELWKRRACRERFISLWKEIARRLKDEPVVIGYGLLNEPYVTKGIYQWERLAKETVAAIREVDRRHVIIVERVSAVQLGNDWWENWEFNRNGLMNFFVIKDTNIMYEFHQYLPVEFTHQGANWIPGMGDQHPDYPGWFTGQDGKKAYVDMEYFRNMAVPLLTFATHYNVPLYMGEFSVIRQGFDNNHNGLGWVSDMIDFAVENNISFCYHAYHDPAFGLYGNPVNMPPGYINKGLAELFRRKL